MAVTADDQTRRGLDSSERNLDQFDGKATKSLNRVAQAAKLAGAALAAGIVVETKRVADAAKDAEASQAKVEKMVQNAGLSWKKYGDQIDAAIQKQSQLFGLDDEDLAESFGNFLRTTGDINEALKLNALAADVARTKGQDLAGAQSLLARVYNGSFLGLKRLGIAFEPVTTAQDRLKASTSKATDEQKRAAQEADKVATRQAAIAALQEKFGGQAKAYGETTAGAVDRAGVAVENLEESLGTALLPALATVAQATATFVTQLQTGEGAGGRVVSVVGGIAGAVRSVGAAATGSTPALAGLGGGLGAIAGYLVVGKLVAFAGAMRTAAAATSTWTAALARNPIGLAAVAIGTLVGALTGLGIGQRAAATSAQEFTDALNRQRDAARALADSEIDLAQRRANLNSANAAIVAAERELSNARRSGDTDRVRNAEASLEQARVSQRRATVDLNRWEEDNARLKRESARATAESAKQSVGRLSTLRREISVLKDERDELRRGIAAGKESGSTKKQLGALEGRLGEVTDELRAKQARLNSTLRQMPKEVRTRIGIDSSGLISGLKGIKGLADKIIGASGGGLPLPGRGVDQFTPIAARFDLGMTSGFRHGDDGYHGINRARDYSNGSGPTPEMLAFAQFLAANYGPRLKELIYTPLGYGIKDGKRTPIPGPIYGKKIAAEHRNHVHVAYREGGLFSLLGGLVTKPTVVVGEDAPRDPEFIIPTAPQFRSRAIGLLASAAKAIGFAKGGKYSKSDLASLWVQAGGSASAANIAASVALAESGGIATRDNRNDDGSIDRGLWQINSVHGALSVFGPLANARAAVKISKNGRDWSPWVAYTNGAFRRFLDQRFSTKGAKTKGPITLGTIKQTGRPTVVQQEADAQLRDAQQQAEQDRPEPIDYLEADAALASLTPQIADDLAAAQRLRDQREADLEKARRSGDPRKITQAVAALKAADDSLAALAGPRFTPTEEWQSWLSLAQLTPNAGDDLGALRQLEQIFADALDTALVNSDIVGAGQAAQNLAGVRGQIDQLTPGEDDLLARDQANAALTETTDDDRLVANQFVSFWQRKLDEARAAGDVFGETEAARNLKQAIDAVESLTGAINANTDAITKQANELLKNENDRLRRELNVSQAQYPALERVLATVVSRNLGGRIGLSLQTPSAPGRVAHL